MASVPPLISERTDFFLSILSWRPELCVGDARLKSEKVFLLYGCYQASNEGDALYGAHHIFGYSIKSGQWHLWERRLTHIRLSYDKHIN